MNEHELGQLGDANDAQRERERAALEFVNLIANGQVSENGDLVIGDGLVLGLHGIIARARDILEGEEGKAEENGL